MEEESNNKQKKNRLKDIKEFLSDKKNKAIVKLIIYLIFFKIVSTIRWCGVHTSAYIIME